MSLNRSLNSILSSCQTGRFLMAWQLQKHFPFPIMSLMHFATWRNFTKHNLMLANTGLLDADQQMTLLDGKDGDCLLHRSLFTRVSITLRITLICHIDFYSHFVFYVIWILLSWFWCICLITHHAFSLVTINLFLGLCFIRVPSSFYRQHYMCMVWFLLYSYYECMRTSKPFLFFL